MNAIKAAMAAVVLASPAAGQAAVPIAAPNLVNGSFETYLGQPAPDPIRQALGNSDGSVDGWTNNGGYQIIESNADGLPARDGTHYISFGHNGAVGGTLSQVFATVIGQTYTVRYFIAQQQGVDANQLFSVSAGARTIASGAPPVNGWRMGTPLTFLATSAMTMLTFRDATPAGSGGGSNLALDNVSVSLGGVVPEAGTWALLIAGFGCAGVALRRRRQTELGAIA